jgi:hypothetical protein
MVHALQEVLRSLQSGGVLVDMRPHVTNPFVEVLDGEEISIAGRLDDTADLPDVLAADQTLALALERGWLQKLAEDSFMHANYWDTPQEMLAYFRENWQEAILTDDVISKAEQLAEAAGPTGKLRIQFPMMIKSYRKNG